MQQLIRRDFLKLSLIPFLATFFGCSRSPELNQDLSSAVQEDAFSYFLDVVFPSHLFGLQAYRKDIIRRLKNLRDSDSKQVVKCYHLFKSKYEDEHDSFNSYTLVKGESVIVQLLATSPVFGHSETVIQALDIIYEQISKVKELPSDLWGRKYSVAHKMCVYWDNYDKPVI